MITAWQLSAIETVPERLVKFGRVRRAISISVLEDDRGLRVEARIGRKLIERIDCGDDRATLRRAIERAQTLATAEMLAVL